MKQNRRLILFATSENPDPYINAICYGVLHKDVKSIEVVAIADHSYAGSDYEPGKERAHYVLSKILAQLQGLSEGGYWPFKAGEGVQFQENLDDPTAKDLYKTVLESINRGGVSATTISFGELFARLRQWGSSGAVVFDVTALQKNLLVDVVSSSLLLDFAEVYSFELRKAHVTHDQDDLFHKLKPERDFVYRNLLQSAPVEQASRRIKRWKIQLRAYFVLAALVFVMPFILAIIWPAEKVAAYIGFFSSLLTIATALLPFVREKFE